MTNALASDRSFQMAGARGILERAGAAIQIREQVKAIEESVHSRPAIVFDLAKALVETTCKTILKELDVDYGNNRDVPQLLKETLTQLQLSPSDYGSPSGATQSIKKTVNGLMTTVHGLCELRSREGMASHGREAYSANLDPAQALLAASAADTVISFLWNVHKSYSPAGKPERISYEDNPEFNEWIDQIHEPPVMIFELPYKRSEILFHLDPQAYDQNLREYSADSEPSEDVEESPADETVKEITKGKGREEQP